MISFSSILLSSSCLAVSWCALNQNCIKWYEKRVQQQFSSNLSTFKPISQQQQIDRGIKKKSCSLTAHIGQSAHTTLDCGTDCKWRPIRCRLLFIYSPSSELRCGARVIWSAFQLNWMDEWTNGRASWKTNVIIYLYWNCDSCSNFVRML